MLRNSNWQVEQLVTRTRNTKLSGALEAFD